MLPIAREFQGIFVVATLMLITLQVLLGMSMLPMWILWLLFAFFIRDFHREIPPVPLAAISPIDGNIKTVGLSYDPFIDRSALCYSVTQSVWGEFNMHSPVEGKVEQLWIDKKDGIKFLAYWIRTDEQDDVIVQIELKSIFQHASTDIHPGERVGQGKRCGFVGLGCRVNIYLPDKSSQTARVNQKVVAGKHVMATLVHQR